MSSVNFNILPQYVDNTTNQDPLPPYSETNIIEKPPLYTPKKNTEPQVCNTSGPCEIIMFMLCAFAVFGILIMLPAIIISIDANQIGIHNIIKYKDFQSSICMGGQNISNISYSPPYPFNTIPTYSPADVTFNTVAVNNSGQVIPVYGKVPTLYDYITRPITNCKKKKCTYRLGDLQEIIYKLQGSDNFTCVLDANGNLFSFENKSRYLNDLYNKYNIAKILYIVMGTALCFTFILALKYRIVF